MERMMISAAKTIFLLSIRGILVINFISCTPAYKGPASDHFDGTEFFNNEPDNHSFWNMVKWLWEMDTEEWPEWIEDPVQPKPVERVGMGDLRITFINHATVLIQMDSLNILIDPIWSERAGPYSWLGAKRVRAPGVCMDSLPQIDYILISHDHYDHLDLPSLKKLVKVHQPVILCGLGVNQLLYGEEINNMEEMDWWQSHQAATAEVTFTFVPARHGSGRGLFSGNETLWGGFVIASPSGEVYFAGDTGFGDFINSISERFSRIRLAILPIGNYEKRWFMKDQHMNPDDAVRTHKILNSCQSMGIHFGTFNEHPEQTIDAHEKDLTSALKIHNVQPSKFWILQFGEGRDVKALPAQSDTTQIIFKN